MPNMPSFVPRLNQSLLGLLLACSALGVGAQTSPQGLWRSVDEETGQAKAQVRIQVDAKGNLSGRVEKILVAEDDVTCEACQDDRRGQRIQGMEIIRGVRQVDQGPTWEGGTILDPDSGKTYKVRLTPLEGGRKLEIRGSWGPFWRTQIWLRIP